MSEDTSFSPEDLYHQAWRLYSDRKFHEAARVFEQAIAVRPSEPDYLYALGLTLEAAGEGQKAVGAFQKAIAGLPNVENKARAGMLQRMAQGHINKITTGDWGTVSPIKEA